jgi:hypothetical protein
LAVKVFAIYHEKAFFDVWVILEQRGCLKRGEGFAAAGSVPNVAVAAVLVDTIYNIFDGINLVGPHHQEFLLAGHPHHVMADHLAQRALGEEFLGKAIQVGDLLIVNACELVNGQEALVSAEVEMSGVVVGKVPGAGAVADDEELDEAQQGFAVAVAWVVFVINNLLHGSAGLTARALSSICTTGTPLMSRIAS